VCEPILLVKTVYRIPVRANNSMEVITAGIIRINEVKWKMALRIAEMRMEHIMGSV